jgi:hypothetical protein
MSKEQNERNLHLYTEVAEIAKQVFASLKKVNPGIYTLKQLDMMTPYRHEKIFEDYIDEYGVTRKRQSGVKLNYNCESSIDLTEIVTVNSWGNTFSFPKGEVFRRLIQLEKLIKTSDKVKFVKDEEIRGKYLCEFRIPEDIKLHLKAKDDDGRRTVMNFVHIDLGNDVIFSSNGYILKVEGIAIPGKSVEYGDKMFPVPTEVLNGKPGEWVTCYVDGENIIAKSENVTAKCKYHYPYNWMSVSPSFRFEQSVCFGKNEWKMFQKTVKAVNKEAGNRYRNQVCLRGKKGEREFEVSFNDVDYEKNISKKTPCQEIQRDFQVKISAYSVALAKEMTTMWILDHTRPVCLSNIGEFIITMPIMSSDDNPVNMELWKQDGTEKSIIDWAGLRKVETKNEKIVEEKKNLPAVVPVALPVAVVEEKSQPIVEESVAVEIAEETQAVVEDIPEHVETAEEIPVVTKKRRSKEELASEEKFVIVTNQNGDKMRARLLKISEKKGTANCLFKGHNRFSVPISQISDTEDQTSGFTLPEWLVKGSKITSDGISSVIVEKVLRSSVSCVESPEIKLRDVILFYRPFVETKEKPKEEKKIGFFRRLLKKVACFSF